VTQSAVITVVLLACVGALLAIAVWAGRRTYNAANFVIANRRLDSWLVSLSYAASIATPWMLLLVSAAAFTLGLAAVWIWGAFVAGAIVSAWFVAPRLRSVSLGESSVTLAQVLCAETGDRLQPMVVRSAVLITLVSLLLQIGAMLHGAQAFLIADLDLDLTAWAALAVALMSICVFAGGLWAAAVSDAAQTIVTMLILMFLPLPALVAIGGVDGFQAAMSALDPAMTDWFGGKSGVVAVAFSAGLFGIGFALPGQPQAVNRYMAAKDEATLRAVRWIAPAWIAALTGAAIFCGWCAAVLYAGLDNPEQTQAALATRLLPPSLAAVLVLALLTAIVFSMGSHLLTLAASLAVDLRRQGIPMSIEWMRAALVFVGMLACFLVLYAPAKLFDQGMFAFTALGASFGPLLFVRLSGKRIRPGVTLAAMWSGFALSAVFHLLPDTPGDFFERVLPFIASLGIALTGGERRRNPDRADRAQETVHDRVPI
jgi:sodium/proline symporter